MLWGVIDNIVHPPTRELHPHLHPSQTQIKHTQHCQWSLFLQGEVNLLWCYQRFAQLKAESSLPLQRERNSYVNIVAVLVSVRSSNKELVKPRDFNKIMWQEMSGWHDGEKFHAEWRNRRALSRPCLSQRVSTDKELRWLKITKVCLFPYHQGHQLPGKSFGQDSMKVLMLRQVSRAPHYPL